jgi:hypothetical protein
MAMKGVTTAGKAAREMPKKVNEWLSNFKTTPIQKPSLYHETSLDKAASIFKDDLLNTVEEARPSKMFVTDNPDIALGQSGQGVLIEFDGNLVSGKEHIKPGTGKIAGTEYITDAFAQNSIKSIVLKQGGELPVSKTWKKVLENDFSKEIFKDGSIKWTRKNKTTIDEELQENPFRNELF